MAKRRTSPDKELGQRITIRLDLPSHAQLQEYAASEGFTPSLLVRHLVKRFLDNQRRLKINPLKGISA